MASPHRFPVLRLKPGEDRRVDRGHAWVFSNEIAGLDGGTPDGAEVAVISADGNFLGSALYSAHSLLAARIYSRRSRPFDAEYLREAIAAAAGRRAAIAASRQAYRVVFSESDFLPGLILDRYGDVLVVQLLTRGIDIRREMILDVLAEVLPSAAIVERSDSSSREHEGLERRAVLARGALPEGLVVDVNTRLALRMGVDVLGGQKTGLFLDQVENWRLLEAGAAGESVLDLFCHAGGWSLTAAACGAKSVVAVDSSQPALDALCANMKHSGSPPCIETVRADCFDFLHALSGRKFDTIICDPPAFAKTRKALKGALRGYRDLNRLAMKALKPGGTLVTCSCSHHVSNEDFDHMLALAAKDAGRQFWLRASPPQPADHPVLVSVPETAYLKVRVLEAAGERAD